MELEIYSLSWWGMLVAGLGIFILGITFLGEGLKKIAGNRLKTLIDKYTSNPFKGLIVGLGVTTIIQSSSATTALVIGLIRVGLMSLPQALGVIMGANIGTTVTAFLIGLDIGGYSPFILTVGAFLYLFASKHKTKAIGTTLFGFGCLFFGLELMDMTLKILAKQPEFINLISSLNTNPIIGLLIGTFGTAAIQSSSAFIGIVQSIYEALSDNQAITIVAVLPLLFGSNIGTTITAVLAAMGGSVAAKRAALFHILFNVFGAILLMILLQPFANLLVYLTSVFSLSPKMQIAIAHIIFNVFTTIIMFPLIKQTVVLIKKIIPGEDPVMIELDLGELEHSVVPLAPSNALEIAKRQAIKMGNLALHGVDEVYQYFATGIQEHCDQVLQIENMIDTMNDKLSHYLLEMSQGELSDEDVNEYGQIMNVIKDFERMSDHCENLVEFYQEAVDRKSYLVAPALDEILEMLLHASSMVKDAIRCYETRGVFLADIVYDKEEKMDQYQRTFRENHITRVVNGQCDSTKFIGLVYFDILSNIERIGDHANNVAEASRYNHSSSLNH